MIKNCRNCQKPFNVKPSHFERTSYCSKACMSEDYKTRYAGEGNPNSKPERKRTCLICGNVYNPRNKAQKYCSSRCRGLALVPTTDYAAMSRKATHLKTDVKIRNCTCTVCGKQFITKYTERRFRCDEHRRVAKKTACKICGKVFEIKGSRSVCCSKECDRIHKAASQRGSRSHRWQGGRTRTATLFRNSVEYDDWRKAVFKRDNYTCQMCNSRGHKLAAHHIKPFANHSDLALVVANGITLCWTCHHSIKGKEGEHESTFFAITGGL